MTTFLQEMTKLIPRGLLSEAAQGEKDSTGKLTAEVYDKLVGRFAQGFGIDQIASMMRVKQVSAEEQSEVFDEILSNKEVIIKKALEYLRDDEISWLKQLLFYARKHGYDYPEFKAIEKSMGIKEASHYGSDAGPLTEAADSGQPIGPGIRADKRYLYLYAIRNSKPISTRIKFSSKAVLLRLLLTWVKNGEKKWPYGPANIWAVIKAARASGHDYPEFKAIEKSAMTDMKESSSQRITLNLSGEGSLWWKDRDSLIKSILELLRNSNPNGAKNLINISRKNGYDYPEFKTIEKSADAELKRVKEGSSQRAFAAGYRDDANVQFITRKKGKKETKNIIVKETFTAHDVHVDTDGDIWVH